MIDPGFLDELDRFTTSIARDTHARRQGDRESPAVGEGLTFADFRQYAPGDEPRRVDWKLYARTQELYVTQYEEERQASVHVLLDASGSMDFGEGETHKFEFGAKLGLGAAYLAARDHEQFRFSTVAEHLERFDRSRSSRGEVLRLIDRCNDCVPEGPAALGDSLEAYRHSLDTTSLVLVVSDFLDAPEAIRDGVAALGDHDVVLAHVLAPEERDPPASGDTVFAETETGRTLRTYFGGDVAREYEERLADHVDDVAATAHELGARHVEVDTGRPFFDVFADLWVTD
ncbi:MAG: DUF58 domain-containing protein [Halobacteriaceae archaeon]